MKHLTELQAQVSEYDKRYGWVGDKPSHIVVHMGEELGEIGRHVLRHEGYKKEKFEPKELGEELTDILYLTLKLANSFQIDLDAEWSNMWKRYEKKTSRL
jgi:NTP pyrophosphatase (non-canonical NTP hydrolase)